MMFEGRVISTIPAPADSGCWWFDDEEWHGEPLVALSILHIDDSTEGTTQTDFLPVPYHPSRPRVYRIYGYYGTIQDDMWSWFSTKAEAMAEVVEAERRHTAWIKARHAERLRKQLEQQA